MDEILTLKELSEYLKVAEKTLYGYAQKGLVPGIRIGSAWRFRKTDIDEWLEERRRVTESSYKEGKVPEGPRRGPKRTGDEPRDGSGSSRQAVPARVPRTKGSAT